MRTGISEAACVLGTGCSAAAVCILNFMAGEWETTKTVVSMGFIVFATAAPLLSRRWFLKIPIFLHIFRHALPAVILGAIAGALKSRRAVLTTAVIAGVIPLGIVALTLFAHMKGAYDSAIPLWLYLTNWGLGAVYWFFGAFYSGAILMGYLKRKTRPAGNPGSH
ncbi:MAG: hypothetical protein U5R49_01185 [Deltaproteobacteria bacterium]|nr:hypothetical protein [Deltaproteobacteria bacterium]